MMKGNLRAKARGRNGTTGMDTKQWGRMASDANLIAWEARSVQGQPFAPPHDPPSPFPAASHHLRGAAAVVGVAAGGRAGAAGAGHGVGGLALDSAGHPA